MDETRSFIRYEKQMLIMKIFGWVFIAAVVADFALLLYFIISVNTDMITVYIMIGLMPVLAACAGALFASTAKHASVIKLYRAYKKVLDRDPHNAVDEINQSLGIPREQIVADFIYLNRRGFFDSIFIDEEHGIVNSGRKKEGTNEFTCPVCGGKTLIEQGQADICGFCGALAEREEENKKEEDQ